MLQIAEFGIISAILASAASTHRIPFGLMLCAWVWDQGLRRIDLDSGGDE